MRCLIVLSLSLACSAYHHPLFLYSHSSSDSHFIFFPFITNPIISVYSLPHVPSRYSHLIFTWRVPNPNLYNIRLFFTIHLLLPRLVDYKRTTKISQLWYRSLKITSSSQPKPPTVIFLLSASIPKACLWVMRQKAVRDITLLLFLQSLLQCKWMK